jgi:4-hydroxyproline epimerase
MCGHGTIGLVATLAHLGRIRPGEHVIETPVGDVRATLQDDGRVSVRNVPAWRLAADVAVTLPTGQTVTGDIAWGGNWFFLCADHGQAVRPGRVAALTDYAAMLGEALHAQGHRGADGAAIDHIELFAADDAGADSRSFVLCPGRQYDRSPCGTGTSAKLACLAARGKLAPGQVWRQASVIGSVFDGWYEDAGTQIVPTIRGQAFITAEATLLIDPADPFGWGLP